MPVWRQACSFVLRLCGSKLVVLYYACVAAKKEKKKRRKNFVASVAVSLELVVLYYACGAASLKFCVTPVWRQVCSFVACVAASLWFYHACMALSLYFI